jgi:hypothetical protein
VIVACSSSVDSFGTVRSLLSEAGLRAWPVHMGFVLVAGMVRPWGSAAHLLGNASVLWSGSCCWEVAFGVVFAALLASGQFCCLSRRVSPAPSPCGTKLLGSASGPRVAMCDVVLVIFWLWLCFPPI